MESSQLLSEIVEQTRLLKEQNDLLKKQLHVAEQTMGWIQQISADIRTLRSRR